MFVVCGEKGSFDETVTDDTTVTESVRASVDCNDAKSFGEVQLSLLNPDVNGDGNVPKDEK